MFSFNKKGAIKPIAEIHGGPEDGELLYLHAKDPYSKSLKSGFFDEITLKPNQHFEFFPDVREDQTDCITLSGKKGVGKSVLASKLAQKMKEVFNLDDNDVIVVKKSDIEDKAFKNLNPAYIYANDEFLENPPTLDEITEDGRPKVLILDDLDNIQSNKLKKAVVNFKDELYREGRKFGVMVITCNHRMCSGKDTKAELTESSYFLFFPAGITSDFKYCLQKYADLSLDFIRELKHEKSRWVMVHNESPMFILSEKRALIFDGDREEDRLKDKKEEKKEKREFRKLKKERKESESSEEDY